MCNFCLFFFSLLPTIIEVLLSWQIRNGDGQWVIINVFSPLSQMCRSILTDYCVLCSLREYYGFVSWPACGSVFGCTKRISDCQLSKCSPTVRPQLQRTVGIAMRANNWTTRKKTSFTPENETSRDELSQVDTSRVEPWSTQEPNKQQIYSFGLHVETVVMLTKLLHYFTTASASCMINISSWAYRHFVVIIILKTMMSVMFRIYIHMAIASETLDQDQSSHR